LKRDLTNVSSSAGVLAFHNFVEWVAQSDFVRLGQQVAFEMRAGPLAFETPVGTRQI